MTRILLAGSTGQVGWELQRTLMSLGEVITARCEVCSPGLHLLRMHLTQPDTISHVIPEVQPDLMEQGEKNIFMQGL